MPKLFPIEKTYDPRVIDGRLSGFEKLPYAIQVSPLGKIAQCGTATVDGVPLSRCVPITAMGHQLLLVPVGEVAKEYGRTYTVHLEGFQAENGKAFSPLTFRLKTAPKRQRDPAFDAHDAAALDAAREGMVLLKNEGSILPLEKDAVLNCFGVGQHMYRVTATGASLINPRWQPSFTDAVRDHSGFRINERLSSLYTGVAEAVPSEDDLRAARALGDTALIFLTRHAGEFQDGRPIKGQYYLSDDEERMIAAVCGTFGKVAVILNTGYPIDMRWTETYNIGAILYTGYAGMLSSYALVEILDGRTNPSGRLACTWPWDYFDNPVSRNFPTLKEKEAYPGEDGAGVRIYYEEDIYMGYRYFDTFQKPVAFPFGHGKSYTDFVMSAQEPRQTETGFLLSVTVTNRGERSGKTVVQLYVAAPDGPLEKPAHVLADFAKTRLLAPGESETLTLAADRFTFSSFDETRSAYVLEKGDYTVSLGDSVAALTQVGRFSLSDDLVVKHVSHLGCPVEEFKRLTKSDAAVDGSKSRFTALKENIAVPAARKRYAPSPLKKPEKKITWQKLLRDPARLDGFVAQMTTDELCKLNICGGNRFMLPWHDGAAGFTPKIGKYALPSFSVADANAGWNMKKPNIGFPMSSVIAQTFNKEIAYSVGKTIAEEAAGLGVSLNLGPSMNLQRGILNGRHPEYFSEDPYLAGTLAGLHGKGLEENGAGCCYKHMFCNNSDTARKGSHSIVSERALRELYFKVFMTAFRIHKPSSVMTSYNALNGLYPAENAELLQDLIRDEWGFEGYIMTDWGSYDTIDMVEMVKAGNCWICDGGPKWVKKLKAAVKRGDVSRAVLENNVRWLIGTFAELSRRSKA